MTEIVVLAVLFVLGVPGLIAAIAFWSERQKASVHEVADRGDTGVAEDRLASGEAQARPNTVNRREFLEGLGYASSGLIVGVAMGVGISELLEDGASEDRASQDAASDQPSAGGVERAVAQAHPRALVGSLSSLAVGDVVDFNYPTEEAPASLFRLGRPAAGGIGPERDIVAFGTLCTHMGCPLVGVFKPEHAVLGPCGCHFTTFDLTHRGMVVIGQATENLPQLILELDGDDILAVGTLGILYGFRDNLADAPLVKGL